MHKHRDDHDIEMILRKYISFVTLRRRIGIKGVNENHRELASAPDEFDQLVGKFNLNLILKFKI